MQISQNTNLDARDRHSNTASNLQLCWKSAREVAETMEKLFFFFHLHKYQQPYTHWQSARLGWMSGHLTAEWCQVAPGHSQWTGDYGRARQQWGLPSHQGSAVQISNGNIDAPQSPECYPRCLGAAICPRNPLFIPSFKLQAHALFFISNPIFRTDCPDCLFASD